MGRCILPLLGGAALFLGVCSTTLMAEPGTRRANATFRVESRGTASAKMAAAAAKVKLFLIVKDFSCIDEYLAVTLNGKKAAPIYSAGRHMIGKVKAGRWHKFYAVDAGAQASWGPMRFFPIKGKKWCALTLECP